MNDTSPPNSGSPTPYLSVVVVFHTRLNYLPAALDSVLNQTLPKNEFEVLVVGPTRPDALVERNADPSIEYVECRETGLGNKVAAGLRKARGEVVAFLEDDDLFEPEKLSFVRDAFRSDPQLAYFQNGFRTIDENGRAIDSEGPDERAMQRWTQRGRVVISGQPSAAELRRFVRIPAGFNNSSIAVRRGRMDPLLPLLDSVDMLVDVTLLYGTLVQTARLCLDPQPLTRLRKHPTSNSDPRLASDSDQLARLRVFADNAQQRRRGLVEFVRGRGSPAVVRAIEGQWAMGVLFQQLRESRYSIADRGSALLEALRRFGTFEVQNYLMAIPLASLLVPTGRFGPGLYIRLRRRFYLQAG